MGWGVAGAVCLQAPAGTLSRGLGRALIDWCIVIPRQARRRPGSCAKDAIMYSVPLAWRPPVCLPKWNPNRSLPCVRERRPSQRRDRCRQHQAASYFQVAPSRDRWRQVSRPFLNAVHAALLDSLWRADPVKAFSASSHHTRTCKILGAKPDEANIDALCSGAQNIGHANRYPCT